MAVNVTALSVASRRGAALALFLVLAAAVGTAIVRPSMIPSGFGPIGTNFSEQVKSGVNKLGALSSTVAGIFESRSPGERVAGALASLKPPRHVVLHQRALPKIRGPLSPLAAIVGAPVVPIAAPAPETPLYNVVSVPSAPVPVALTAPPGSPPIVFPSFTPPPSSGGGVVPPIVTAPPPETPPVTPITPVTPLTSGVPEPATWALMLLGFVMIGCAARRARRPTTIAVR